MFQILLSLSFLATSPAPAVTTLDSCQIAKACTFEYMPATCTYDGMSFKGANRCVALLNIERFLCEQELDASLEDLSIDCQLDQPNAVFEPLPAEADPIPADQEPTSDCFIAKACTREYDPHTCSFQGQDFEGSNRCMSLLSIEQYICEQDHDLSIEDATITCRQNISENQLPISLP